MSNCVKNNRINLTDFNDKMPIFKIKMKRLFLTLNNDKLTLPRSYYLKNLQYVKMTTC